MACVKGIIVTDEMELVDIAVIAPISESLVKREPEVHDFEYADAEFSFFNR